MCAGSPPTVEHYHDKDRFICIHTVTESFILQMKCSVSCFTGNMKNSVMGKNGYCGQKLNA